MRKWLKRLVFLVLLVVLGIAITWRALSGRLTEYARETIEHELGAALQQPVTLRELSISLVPVKVEAAGLTVGENGEAIRADEVRVRILPWSSLKQLRPVGEAEIAGAVVDVTKLAAATSGATGVEETSEVAIFPFRLRDLRVKGARVRIPAGELPLELETDSLAASGGLSAISRRWSLQLDGDLRVRRGARELRIDELRLQGAEASDGWVVQRLDLTGDGVEAQGKLVGRNPPRHVLTAKLELAWLQLIDPGLDWLSGDLALQAELTGSLVDPDGTATVRVGNLNVDGRALGNLDATVARKAELIELESSRLQALGGELDVQGQLSLSERQPVQVSAVWHDVDVASLFEASDHLPALSSSGSVHGSGTLDPLAGSAEGSGSLSQAEITPLEWTLGGDYEDGTGTVRVRASQSRANTVRCDVKVAGDESLAGEVNVGLADIGAFAALVGREGEVPFSGSLKASAKVSGSASAPVVDGEIEGTKLLAFGEPVGAVRGNFLVDREHARSDGLVWDFGDGDIRASGTIGFTAQTPNDWRATVRNVRIDRVAGLVERIAGVTVPLSKGRLSARANGSGPWSQVEANGHLEVSAFELDGEPFESVVVDADTSWPRWNVETAVVHAGEERLDARARGVGIEEITDSSLHSSAWSLDHLQFVESAGLRGRVQVEAAMRGKIEALSGRVTASGRNLAWSDHELGDAVVDGEGNVGNWRVKTDVLGDTVHLVGDLDSSKGEFRIEANWSGAELGPLLLDDPNVRIASSGEMRLGGDLHDPGRLGGEARIASLSIRSGGLQIEAREPIRISADKGRFDIESLVLGGNGTTMSLTGDAATSGELHLRAEGAGSLELLELIGEPIESVKGRFEVAANLDRRAGQPIELGGTVSVTDAALDVGLPIGMTETNGELVLEGSRVRIARFEGQLGGGTFSLGGGVDLRGGPDIEWKLVDVSGSLVPSLEQELSGHGALRGPWNDLTVSGEVEILRMLYDRNIEPSDFVPSFKRRLTAPAKKPSPNVVRLDLHVYAPDDLYIDNNFARVEARTDLQVKGTTLHPKLRGRIEVLNGEVFFRDRTFNIVTGVVDFRPQLDLVADLSITAETVVETADASYGITVQISGTTDDPKVVLSADDPGLTQTDIVSLITFGKTVAQLQQGSGGSSMDALIGFVTGRVAKPVESGATALLPVDRVEFEPAFSSTTGAFEPQVKISKDFGEDLTASVATTLGVDLQRSVNLEYRLSDRTSLLGTWESESEGQAGAIGGGVKFRREFRRIPGFSLLGTTGK